VAVALAVTVVVPPVPVEVDVNATAPTVTTGAVAFNGSMLLVVKKLLSTCTGSTAVPTSASPVATVTARLLVWAVPGVTIGAGTSAKRDSA